MIRLLSNQEILNTRTRLRAADHIRPRFYRPSLLILLAVPTVATLAGGCHRAATPNPNNELPFGTIDAPRNGEVVGRVVEVAGWALDDSTVRVVRVYVDGKYESSAELKFPRPDVSKAFVKYVRRDAEDADMHGWHTTVDLGATPGPHTILAQAIDDENATRDLVSVTVNLIGRQ